jgi:hypothetical protein
MCKKELTYNTKCDQVLGVPSLGIERIAEHDCRITNGDSATWSRVAGERRLGASEVEGSGCPTTFESDVMMEPIIERPLEESSQERNQTLQARQPQLSLPPPWQPGQVGDGQHHNAVYIANRKERKKRTRQHSAFSPRLHGRPGKGEQHHASLIRLSPPLHG